MIFSAAMPRKGSMKKWSVGQAGGRSIAAAKAMELLRTGVPYGSTQYLEMLMIHFARTRIGLESLERKLAGVTTTHLLIQAVFFTTADMDARMIGGFQKISSGLVFSAVPLQRGRRLRSRGNFGLKFPHLGAMQTSFLRLLWGFIASVGRQILP